MNRVICLLILCLFVSCSGLKSKIEISFSKNNRPVIIRLSKQNTIIRLQFPNQIILANNSYKNESFVKIEYGYDDSIMPIGRDLGLGLFKGKNKTLKLISATGKKTIPSKEHLDFIFYTRHFIDSAKSIQQQFKPYIEKMLAQNKDTLHIGTVSEFKQKHKVLFEKLTKNDSISIQFLDGKKLGERITVPVAW